MELILDAFHGVYFYTNRAEVELLILTSIVGAKVAQEMASSSNPWVYLSGILIIATLIAGRYIFNYLVTLDKQHREESTIREKKLNTQLDKSIQANQSIIETQKEIVLAINGMNTSVQSLENRMDVFEKHIEKDDE